MNVSEKVRELNLPDGEYLVFGSGILGALGIREIGDIDLIVSPRVFDELRVAGWTFEKIEIEGRIRERLSRGEVEVYRDFWYGGHHPDPAALIADSQMIDGIPFLPLEKLVEIKRILARPKDFRDIELIAEYQSSISK
ncbi:zinc ABC transporter substrate-binding protein [Patescibacteria group bacterium]|nr:zinc ABC transporter substrate-binding protein [Patescibacteria group bacterium]